MQQTSTFSLVERKTYDTNLAHQIVQSICWVGFIDSALQTSHNPFLLIDKGEAMLINPGSRADEHYRLVRDKVASLIDPKQIQHIVLLDHDPERCASLPLFEKLVSRNVRIYAPSEVKNSITYYGCKNPVIGLDNGDSIIFGSGRTIDYYATPNVPAAGRGFLFDQVTGTVFSGNVLGQVDEPWNLYAQAQGWRTLRPCPTSPKGSKKAHLEALNKIERLSPERICQQCGLIVEDEIDSYIAAAREFDIGDKK